METDWPAHGCELVHEELGEVCVVDGVLVHAHHTPYLQVHSLPS